MSDLQALARRVEEIAREAKSLSAHAQTSKSNLSQVGVVAVRATKRLTNTSRLSASLAAAERGYASALLNIEALAKQAQTYAEYLVGRSSKVGSATSDVGVNLSADASAAASFESGPHEIVAEASVRAEAELTAYGNIGVQVGLLKPSAGASLTAKLESQAKARASFGPDGASLKAGIAAGATLSAEVHAAAEIPGAAIKAKASASVGLSFAAEFDASFSIDSIKISSDLSVALGVGGGANVRFEIKPRELSHTILQKFGF